MKFQCPFCQGLNEVENQDCGTNVQCGQCAQIVTVPASRVSMGAMIADFIVLQELGRGGMGVVYLAHQISLDRSAALKVLSPQFANNPEFISGFIREARAAAALNHPHIVQAYAVGDDDGIFYFAMESIDGETLKDILKREGRVPVDKTLMIIHQISEALDYAWKEAKIIHCDIKPDNIMMTTRGRAKLADLGLAKVAGTFDNTGDEVMGTPQYISPEQLLGAPLDGRTDIYSLGATFYHAVTGRFPFEGPTAAEIARKHIQEPLVSPKKLVPDIPDDICKVIGKMMAKDPSERYQDAESLVEDLRKCRMEHGPSTATTGVGKATSTKLKKQMTMRAGSTHEASAVSTTTTITTSFKTTHSNVVRPSRTEHKTPNEKKTRMQIMILVGITLAVLAVGGAFVVKNKFKRPSDPAQVAIPADQTPAASPKPVQTAVKNPAIAEQTAKTELLRKLAKEMGESPFKPESAAAAAQALLDRYPEEAEKNVSNLSAAYHGAKEVEDKVKSAREKERAEHLAQLAIKLNEQKKFNDAIAMIEQAMKLSNAPNFREIKSASEKGIQDQKREALNKADAADRDRKNKEKVADQKKRLDEFKDDAANRRDELKPDFVEFGKIKQFSVMVGKLDAYQQSIERKKDDFPKDINEFTDWAKRMKSSVELADAYWKRFSNCGQIREKDGKKIKRELMIPKKGSEDKTRAYGEIEKITDGIMFFNPGAGKPVVEMPLNTLEPLTTKKLIEVFLENDNNKDLSEKNALFHFYLNSGYWMAAEKILPSKDRAEWEAIMKDLQASKKK